MPSDPWIPHVHHTWFAVFPVTFCWGWKWAKALNVTRGFGANPRFCNRQMPLSDSQLKDYHFHMSGEAGNSAWAIWILFCYSWHDICWYMKGDHLWYSHVWYSHTHDMKEVTVNNEITMNDIPYWTCLMHRMPYVIHDLDTQSWNRLRQHVSSPSLQTLLKPRFGCFGQVSRKWYFEDVMEFLESNKSNNTCFVSLNLWRSNVCTLK